WTPSRRRRGRSGLRDAERVAGARVAALQPGAEPALALLRGAVVHRVGDDVALLALHDRVVADRARGAHAFLEVARLEQVALLREVPPHAGVAVGLQLEADRQRVAAALVEPAAL